MSTDNGLAVVDPASFTIRTLRVAEGVTISVGAIAAIKLFLR